MNVGINGNPYRVGQKVRIVSKWTTGCHQNLGGEMDKWLGSTMTVNEIFDGYCRMKEDFGQWKWFLPSIAGLSNDVQVLSDLMNGDIIILRNGNRYIVINDMCGATSGKDWLDLALYDRDMTCGLCLNDFDIMTVVRPDVISKCRLTLTDEPKRFWKSLIVYERKPVEEMTLSEVCKLLGKQIKIIPEKE